MGLTSAQLAALKADIIATPAISSTPGSDDGHFTIAAYYNQDLEYAPQARQASALSIRMNTTIADDMTLSGCAFVLEV